MTQEQENRFLSLVNAKKINAVNDWRLKLKENDETGSLESLKDCYELMGTLKAYIDVICLFELIQEEEEELK